MKEISVEELEQRLVSGARLIDVRESDEYAQGHVPGAISIPLGQIPDRLADHVDESGITYLICKSGGRSSNACEFAQDKGFDVANVVGGTMAWITSGRSVVAGDSPQ